MATRTKQPGGIVTRHSRSCGSRDGKRCNCDPSYEAWLSVRGKKQRKSFTPATHGGGALAAAKNWLADANVARRKGTFRPVSKETLEEAGEAWVAGAKAGEILARGGRPYKPSLIRSYERSLRLRVYPELGDTRLAELTVPELQRFVNQLVAAGANASTIRNTVNPVRAIYRHAIAVGDVVVNPTTGLQLPAVDARRERTATPTEADELLAALPSSERALWATAFYGGLRRGELRALRAADVDVKAGIITVSRSWDDIEGDTQPKSRKGTRKVPIPALLSKGLAEHLAATGRRGDDFIFGSTRDTPFDPNKVRRVALDGWAVENKKRADRKQPELNSIGLHECRHTYVSFMYEAGLPLETIGDFVGHASTYMTDRYRHLMPDALDQARRKMDALLAAAKV